MSPNDDWQIAFQKINSNFRNVCESLELVGTVPDFTDSQQDAISLALNAIVADVVYPVGSVICTTDLSDARLLIGTWVQIFKDKYLKGAGNETSSGSTGGRASFTLMRQNLPDHEHTVDAGIEDETGDVEALLLGTVDTTDTVQTDTTTAAPSKINIDPEYEAAYWFRRTA